MPLKYSESSSSKYHPTSSNRHRRARCSIGEPGGTRRQQFGGAHPAEARNRQSKRVASPAAPTRNEPEGRVQRRCLGDRPDEGTRSDRRKEHQKEHRSQRFHGRNRHSASPTRK